MNCNKESDSIFHVWLLAVSKLHSFFSFCPTFEQAHKKSWVIPTLDDSGEVQTIKISAHAWEISPLPHALTTIKPKPLAPSFVEIKWTCLGTCPAVPRKPHDVIASASHLGVCGELLILTLKSICGEELILPFSGQPQNRFYQLITNIKHTITFLMEANPTSRRNWLLVTKGDFCNCIYERRRHFRSLYNMSHTFPTPT